MTRDDIIRMAREAGLVDYCDLEGDSVGLLALVTLCQDVAAAEREAIAKMIEDAPALVKFATNDHGGCLMCGFTPKLAAAAIRARGEKK